MAKKYITIGSAVNIHSYDDGDFPNSIVVSDPIKQTDAPAQPDETVRVQDLVALAAIWQHNFFAISSVLTSSNVICEATASGITLTLPSAVGLTGKLFILDNASSGSITIDGDGSETINGELTQIVRSGSCMNIYSNGANWRIF